MAAVVAVAMATSCGSVEDDTGDFTLAVTPGMVAVPIASSNMVTISISRTGDVGDVALAAQGLATGITASFDVNPVPAGTNSATVTFTVAPGTAAGSSNVTLVGTAGSIERTVTVSVSAQTITVSGTVRGGGQGVMVRIPGKPAVMSGPGGAFSFSDVSPPYDIYTLGSSGFLNPIPTISYYKGLTRPDPIINVASASPLILLTQSSATVNGTKTGGDATTPMLIAWDGGGSVTAAPSNYSLTARWSPKAPTRAGVLYGFQFTKRPTGAPNTFPGFGSSGQTTLSENTAHTVNINLTAPQTAALTGSITSPAGFPTPTLTLSQQLGGGSVVLWTTNTTTTADATIPVIAAGKSAVFASATLDAATTSFVDPGINAAKDITFALPAPAVQLAPVNAATGVNTMTVFSWTGAPMTVYELNILTTATQGNAQARYLIYTTESMATIPGVPELPLPSNQSFTWQINGYGPKTSINDAATMAGLEGVSPNDFDGERHSFTNSTDRTFTSAP